jgi:hypothetical protein
MEELICILVIQNAQCIVTMHLMLHVTMTAEAPCQQRCERINGVLKTNYIDADAGLLCKAATAAARCYKCSCPACCTAPSSTALNTPNQWTAANTVEPPRV